MNEERLYDLIREKENIASVAFPSLMRKVYVWMTLALVITGFVAYGVASSPGIITALVSNKLLFWGLFIAELALVWTVSARINRLSLTTATLLFILYSALNGATLSLILLVYNAVYCQRILYHGRHVCRYGSHRLFHQGRPVFIGQDTYDGPYRSDHCHCGQRLPA